MPKVKLVIEFDATMPIGHKSRFLRELAYKIRNSESLLDDRAYATIKSASIICEPDPVFAMTEEDLAPGTW